jgi:hypothetical protein
MVLVINLVPNFSKGVPYGTYYLEVYFSALCLTAKPDQDPDPLINVPVAFFLRK